MYVLYMYVFTLLIRPIEIHTSLYIIVANAVNKVTMVHKIEIFSF